jgi:hypothetical protein
MKRYDDAALYLYVVRRELSDEAVQRGLNPLAFRKWLDRQAAPFYEDFRKTVEEANQHLPEEVTIDRAEEVVACIDAYAAAILRLSDRLKSLRFPKSFQGRWHRNQATVDTQALLRRYDQLCEKARTFLRAHRKIGLDTFQEMLLEFIEADHDEICLLEARNWGVFAEAVVAREFGLNRWKVHKLLPPARRAAGHSRVKSRLART